MGKDKKMPNENTVTWKGVSIMATVGVLIAGSVGAVVWNQANIANISGKVTSLETGGCDLSQKNNDTLILVSERLTVLTKELEELSAHVQLNQSENAKNLLVIMENQNILIEAMNRNDQ